MTFPIDLTAYQPLKFSLSQESLDNDQKATLQKNINLVRDAIVFFTALANTKGLGGHTGGAYDIVPELLIADGFMKGGDSCYPVYFDEAGHRVAIQYIMAVLNGYKKPEALLHYREFKQGLYGHPERHEEEGIFLAPVAWVTCGAMSTVLLKPIPEKPCSCLAVTVPNRKVMMPRRPVMPLPVNSIRLCCSDDNDVTIAGHPTEYMQGYDLVNTLSGQGLAVTTCDGERH